MSNTDENILRPHQERSIGQQPVPAAAANPNPHRLFQPKYVAYSTGLLVATALTIYGLKCAYEDPTTILLAFSIPATIGILAGMDTIFNTMQPGQ